MRSSIFYLIFAHLRVISGKFLTYGQNEEVINLSKLELRINILQYTVSIFVLIKLMNECAG